MSKKNYTHVFALLLSLSQCYPLCSSSSIKEEDVITLSSLPESPPSQVQVPIQANTVLSRSEGIGRIQIEIQEDDDSDHQLERRNTPPLQAPERRKCCWTREEAYDVCVSSFAITGFCTFVGGFLSVPAILAGVSHLSKNHRLFSYLINISYTSAWARNLKKANNNASRLLRTINVGSLAVASFFAVHNWASPTELDYNVNLGLTISSVGLGLLDLSIQAYYEGS